MLLSGTASIARILTTVREPVISTVQLRALFAAEFGVEAICPVTTLRALRALAGDPAYAAPWWRVLTSSGSLLRGLPGGANRQADLLRQACVKLGRFSQLG
jgi:hypothetical protein